MARRKPQGWVERPGAADIRECLRALEGDYQAHVTVKTTFHDGLAGWYGYHIAIAWRKSGSRFHVQREMVRFSLDQHVECNTLLWRVLWVLYQRCEAEGFIVMEEAPFAQLFLP